MDTGIIIAIIGSTVAIVGVVISMMFWVRSESNDVKKDQKEDRKDLLEIVRAIHDEMKDFHYRLSGFSYQPERSKREDLQKKYPIGTFWQDESSEDEEGKLDWYIMKESGWEFYKKDFPMRFFSPVRLRQQGER
jgi:hypothetical protein